MMARKALDRHSAPFPAALSARADLSSVFGGLDMIEEGETLNVD